jgi:hypothetical protein
MIGWPTENRLQLVRMNLDRGVPDSKKRLVFDALGRSQPVEAGPAVGVDEGPQGSGAVGAMRVHAGERRRAEYLAGRLDLPKQLVGGRE